MDESAGWYMYNNPLTDDRWVLLVEFINWLYESYQIELGKWHLEEGPDYFHPTYIDVESLAQEFMHEYNQS